MLPLSWRRPAPGPRGNQLKHHWHPPVQCVWTRSASGSLQSVGNIFPFTESSRFAYLENNHNSLLGVLAAVRAAQSAHALPVRGTALACGRPRPLHLRDTLAL